MGPSDPELDTEDVKVIKDVTNDIIERALRIPAGDVIAPDVLEDGVPLDNNKATDIKFAQEDITPGFEEVDLDSFCSSADNTENTEGYREDGPPESLKIPEKTFEDESENHKTEDTDKDTYSDDPPQRLHPDPISRSQSRISNGSSKQKISWGHVDNMAGLTLSLPNNNDVDDKADDRSRKQSQLSNVSNVSSPSLSGSLSSEQRYVWEVWPVAGSQVRLSKKVPGSDDVDIPGGDLEAANPILENGDSSKDQEIIQNGSASPVSESPKRNSPPINLQSPPVRVNRNYAESLQRQPSRSSLASIKSRVMNKVPSNMKSSPEATALKVFVVLLFSLCFAIVLVAHILYNQHIGEVRIFKTIRLEEASRNLLVFDHDNILVSSARLGVNMGDHLHPYKCLPGDHDNPAAEAKCFEWPERATLTISREGEAGDGASCHRIVWNMLNKETFPCDCWPVGGEHGHWYGGGESLVSEWPLDQGSISMEPFVTGDEDQTMWGNVIRKFFINSRGLSIRIADSSPLSVSLNDNSGARERAGALCLEASFNQFPYYYHRYELPVLNYTVCTGGNIKDVYSSQMTRSFWNDHRDSDMTVLKRLLKLPLWQVPGVLGEGETYSLEMIQDYIWSLSGRSRMSGPPSSMPSVERGYLLLDYHWQRHMGDLTFDRASFPNITGLKAAVRAAGLKLAITVNPFVSVESDNFKQGVRDKLFVIERNSTSDKFIPALTWFKDVPVAALLDITNEDAVEWLKSKLSKLREETGDDVVFYLDTGNTFHTPHYFTFSRPMNNPDLYKEHFITAAMEVDDFKVIGVSGASSKRPKAPAFVWMSHLNSSWSSLQSIIPNILHLGVIGYPLINPGPIGGLTNGSTVPDKELFIRWWQLATFLPQLHFLSPPALYAAQERTSPPLNKNEGITPIARSLKSIKDRIVNPLLIKFAGEAMEKSLPLIRPLWMFNPEDENCQVINDQFMIGDTLLVAPVLHQGVRRRSVYLPGPSNGSDIVWKRGTDGPYHRGGQWVQNIEVALDEVLYFEKKADGARPDGLTL